GVAAPAGARARGPPVRFGAYRRAHVPGPPAGAVPSLISLRYIRANSNRLTGGSPVRSRPLLLVGFLVLLLPNLLFAQTNAGSLSGRVTDGSGASLPGVTVTASNAATGFNRTVVTETDGTYRFPSLPVGTYEVTADLA